jgi:hypothetical protein
MLRLCEVISYFVRHCYVSEEAMILECEQTICAHELNSEHTICFVHVIMQPQDLTFGTFQSRCVDTATYVSLLYIWADSRTRP